MIADMPDLYEGGGSNGGDPRYSLLALNRTGRMQPHPGYGRCAGISIFYSAPQEAVPWAFRSREFLNPRKRDQPLTRHPVASRSGR
jgi:hypothetical protein